VISFEEPFESWSQLLERQSKYLGVKALNALGWLSIAFAVHKVAILIGMGDVVRVPIKKISAVVGVVLQWLKTILGLMFGH
jgi:hypothetical protein